MEPDTSSCIPLSGHSPPVKANLLGMSKRGDTYSRTLLIHDARSVICRVSQKADACNWISAIVNRRNKNVAAVALANKNTRIVWALLAHDRQFDAPMATQKQPECKAANLSNNHDAENLFSSGRPCGRFTSGDVHVSFLNFRSICRIE
jgi:hypothetical protein